MGSCDLSRVINLSRVHQALRPLSSWEITPCSQMITWDGTWWPLKLSWYLFL